MRKIKNICHLKYWESERKDGICREQEKKGHQTCWLHGHVASVVLQTPGLGVDGGDQGWQDVCLLKDLQLSFWTGDSRFHFFTEPYKQCSLFRDQEYGCMSVCSWNSVTCYFIMEIHIPSIVF